MADLRPREVVHLDLSRGLPTEDLGPRGEPLFLVLWWHESLLAYTDLPADLARTQLATIIAQLVAEPLGRRLLGEDEPGRNEIDEPPGRERILALTRPLAALDGAPAVGGVSTAPPSVSLVVCTRDRPRDLERCLGHIAAADPGPDELLVVDNAPWLAGTREVVERFPGARYVAESRPGLSAARNAGVRAATCDLVAFVDDDCVVRADWLASLRAVFADDHVMAATGLVLPAELATEAQVTFELVLGGLGYGHRPVRYDRAFVRARHAHGLPVWEIGAGANMAIRRAAFALVGDFDERLGAGATGCSEDSEFWYRLLANGWTCRYEPQSVVLHHHRRDTAGFTRQLHEYLRGHVTALFVQFSRHRHAGNLRRAFLSLPRWYIRRSAIELARAAAVRLGIASPRPVSTLRTEVRGYVHGLASAPMALPPQAPRHKTALRPFLRRNPFPHPYTIGFFYREKMRAIHRITPDLPAGEVLEIGGGQAGLAGMLFPSAHVTCADTDETIAEAAVHHDPRLRFVVADATRLPFADASFDVVTLFDVLEHIPDDRAAAAEALRVLRPGGFVLVTTPDERWRYPYYRVLAPICPAERELFEEWGHVRRGYAVGGLASLFGAAPVRTTGFISAPTALCHDFAWSKLPEGARRVLCSMVAPLTWAGYALHAYGRPGTEVAASWRKPGP